MTPAKTPAGSPRSDGGVDPGVLQRLPGGFEQQALLGVHRQRLARGDGEELGVELGGVGEEAALARIGGAGVLGVGVIEALEVPAAVGGELGDRVAALGDQPPELLGGGDAARVAAGHADDRDRLLARRWRARRLAERSAGARLGQQVGARAAALG